MTMLANTGDMAYNNSVEGAEYGIQMSWLRPTFRVGAVRFLRSQNNQHLH